MVQPVVKGHGRSQFLQLLQVTVFGDDRAGITADVIGVILVPGHDIFGDAVRPILAARAPDDQDGGIFAFLDGDNRHVMRMDEVRVLKQFLLDAIELIGRNALGRQNRVAIPLSDAHDHIAAAVVMEIVGEGADRAQDRCRIPSFFELQAVRLDLPSGQQVRKADRQRMGSHSAAFPGVMPFVVFQIILTMVFCHLRPGQYTDHAGRIFAYIARPCRCWQGDLVFLAPYRRRQLHTRAGWRRAESAVRDDHVLAQGAPSAWPSRSEGRPGKWAHSSWRARVTLPSRTVSSLVVIPSQRFHSDRLTRTDHIRLKLLKNFGFFPVSLLLQSEEMVASSLCCEVCSVR